METAHRFAVDSSSRVVLAMALATAADLVLIQALLVDGRLVEVGFGHLVGDW